jgi:anti-sigma-K factor RskA
MDVNPHRDELLELCAGYVLGNLSDTEKASLEAHLEEGCPTCETEIDRLGRGAWAFAASTPRLLEPSSLRSRVLTAVRTPEPGRRAPIPLPRRRIAPTMAWVAGIAAVLIAAACVYEYQLAAQLSRELASARDEKAKLEQRVSDERELAALLAAPQSRLVQLTATPDGSPGIHARIAYDPASRHAVIAVSDFVAPPGKDYQLWAITKTGPASLGLLHTDSSGHALIRLSNAGDPFTLAAFAVSLEREGGSPTPNAPAGPVVMMGKI